MEPLKLKDVAKAVGLSSNSELQIERISTDTRAICPGSLFVALKGDRFDGHQFAQQAADEGAVAILAEAPVTVSRWFPVLTVPSTRAALLQLAQYYRMQFQIPVVAVTGSVGKTTTKEMIVAALSVKYRTLKTEANLNNQIGLPKTLLRLDHTIEAAVVEMGMDDFGQIHNMSMCAVPSIAVITNIGHCHIETLGSQEGIRKAKLEILDGMDDTSPVILNGDDPMLAEAAPGLNHPVLLYGIESPECDIRAESIEEGAFGLRFHVTVPSMGVRVPVEIPAFGRHFVLDALAAFAVGILLQVDPAAIAEGLAHYTPSGMRQHIVHASGITVVEDCYNASPDSVCATLQGLQYMGDGRKLAVLGDMLELGDYSEAGHRRCGRQAAERGIPIVAIGPQSRFTAEEAQAHGGTATWYADKESAAAPLLAQIQRGDTVLFKASHGIHMEALMNQVYGVWPKDEK